MKSHTLEKCVRKDLQKLLVFKDITHRILVLSYVEFHSFRGPFGLTKEILKHEGFRGLFKGLTATFMREIPGYFFFFGGYETARHLLTPAGKTKDEIGNS